MNLFTNKHYPIFECKITPFCPYCKGFEAQKRAL